MKQRKLYTQLEEEDGSGITACEAAVAVESAEIPILPEDVDYAHIVNGKLQVTPDIEEEIAEVERGETVSMSDFKTMFAKWL